MDTRELDHVTVDRNRCLGSGSYGKVYPGSADGRPVAVKVGRKWENVLEPTIMTSISHPSLNSAVHCCTDEDNLYVVQDAAISDLSKYQEESYSREQKRIWCFQIADAVRALHRENIIHGDVKSSNVLLYSDGTVRLSDFTLSVVKTESSQKFTHRIATATHRPLESFLGEQWDESVDVWALGCTFYEIYCGRQIFPHQGHGRDNVKKKCINAILDWAVITGKSTTMRKFDVEYAPVIPPSEIGAFEDLIYDMLSIYPEERIDIEGVLRHPFFTGLIPVPHYKISVVEAELRPDTLVRVRRFIQVATQDEKVASLALSIYRKSLVRMAKESTRAATCASIASRILFGQSTIKSKRVDEVLEEEICNDLDFRLL